MSPDGLIALETIFFNPGKVLFAGATAAFESKTSN